MKTLIPCYVLLLGALSASAQSEQPSAQPAPNAHDRLCHQLDLVKGGEYVIEIGTPSDQSPPISTVLSLGDNGWIQVMQKKRRIGSGPKWINLAQVSSIMRVEKTPETVPSVPSGDKKPGN